MCGIEILLCCAAGGAAGCCYKNKRGKKSKQKSGVKGEAETYGRHSKENRKPKPVKGNKDKKQQQGNQSPAHRIPAYEMYQARYAEPATDKERAREGGLHRRSTGPDSPRAGQMDAEEFTRLKQVQQSQKLNSLW